MILLPLFDKVFLPEAEVTAFCLWRVRLNVYAVLLSRLTCIGCAFIFWFPDVHVLIELVMCFFSLSLSLNVALCSACRRLEVAAVSLFVVGSGDLGFVDDDGIVFVVHFPGRGQSSLFRQLQFFRFLKFLVRVRVQYSIVMRFYCNLQRQRKVRSRRGRTKNHST